MTDKANAERCCDECTAAGRVRYLDQARFHADEGARFAAEAKAHAADAVRLADEADAAGRKAIVAAVVAAALAIASVTMLFL
ncbi:MULTISPECIES: hypothetical protein [unclassified Micromonospora]|uniref:hypothetical protein n=1 Tax=unclassified Micromonospora TaxID=2617518 RepID=UPI003327BE95